MRNRQARRVTVEQCCALDIGVLRKAGIFTLPVTTPCDYQWNDAGQEIGRVELRLERRMQSLFLRVSDRYSVADDFIAVVTSGCPFGGLRRWFLCPARESGGGCRRRVMRVYRPPGEHRFACRLCWGLTYQSTQQHDDRVNRLRRYPATVLWQLATTGSAVTQRLAWRAMAANREQVRKRLGWINSADEESAGEFR